MSLRLTVVSLASVGALSLVWSQGSSWAQTNSEPAKTVAAVAPAMLPTVGEATFVGSSGCKKCHIKEHKSWVDTKHGKAMDALKPGAAKETKEKFKLDPSKDYSQDAACLKCHSVGFGKPGGYAVPAAGDEKAGKEAAKLAGVGCESCHGAGSEYSKIFEDIQKNNRKYKLEELTKAGLVVPNEATCKTCHENKENPTMDPAKPFDFAKMKETGVHEIAPLKLREG